MIKQIFFIAFFAVCSSLHLTAFAQKHGVIKLDNPSFEDYPQAGHQPVGWFDCGFAGETPPDVNPTGQFKVSKNAYHGSTYVGMVTRDNNTWEAIGQRLKSPLLKGVTYTFSIYLARSEIYISQSRATGRDVNYITPATLRIWGGSGYCSKEEMIAETEPISAATWQKFSFKFTPKANHNYFMIEAFYKVPTLFPYNGNVLVDNASDIVPENKEEKKPDIAQVTPKPPKPPVTPPTTATTPKLPVIAIIKPANKGTVKAPSVELVAKATNIADKNDVSVTLNGSELSDFNYDKDNHLIKSNLKLSEGNNTIVIRVKNKDGDASTSTAITYEAPVVAVTPPPAETKTLKEGTIIKIEKLQFLPNSSNIDQDSYNSLDAIYTLLANNPNIVIEIGGHTNLVIEEGMSLRLSTNRAKAVADYLIGKGINKDRLVTKGYGRNFPIENNTTQTANKVNQRVEIKILSTNG
jgi:outer membrane protein OmpA-like peptidoglycan-associated protein